MSPAQPPHIRQAAFNCRRRGHCGTHQMGARSPSLTSRKIAVRSVSAPLARRDDLSICAEAHGTPGLAPLKSGLDEHSVEPFFPSLLPDKAGTWNHPGLHAVSHLAPAYDLPRAAQIFDPAIRA